MTGLSRMDRRRFLVAIGSTATALVVRAAIDRALAQGATAISPRELQRRLSALEERARVLRLPEVPPAQRRRRAPRITQGNAYLEGMPRLLELIERSELGRQSAEVGEAAAELLSRLHRQEYGWA